ncbi:hypothetical protein [Limisphaera ngatamarikiensis]|uniref:hypothetical protein n=1 Tax=Limisphaera ngatamarikiensis TaxID=1324935 RepID=UPI0013ECB493|nr:hypothetical protein [Limisphaera ngatamarikiensis]
MVPTFKPDWPEVNTEGAAATWMIGGTCGRSTRGHRHFHWTGLCAVQYRSQYSTLSQIRGLVAWLPSAFWELDCDNGGQLLNHHWVPYLRHRSRPVLLTRARPWCNYDHAHGE